jgi:hypothetical protein
MKDPKSPRSFILMMSLIYGIVSLMQVLAKEHSWVTPMGCTPAELILMRDRQIIGSDKPVLLPHEKLVIKLDESQLVLEVVGIEAEATKVNWLWIGSKKVLSGSAVIENSDIWGPRTKDSYKPFDFERVGGADLKDVMVACSSDVRDQRVTFILGRKYALITKENQGEQAAPSDGDKPSN